MELYRVRHDQSDLACMHVLEKEMATHPSLLVWRIPGCEEPGGQPSVGSHMTEALWQQQQCFLIHTFTCCIAQGTLLSVLCSDLYGKRMF